MDLCLHIHRLITMPLLATDQDTVGAAAVLHEEGVLVEIAGATLARAPGHLATAAGVDTLGLHPDPPLVPVLLLPQSPVLFHLTHAESLVLHLLQRDKILTVHLLETTTARRSHQVHGIRATHQKKEVAPGLQLQPSCVTPIPVYYVSIV